MRIRIVTIFPDFFASCLGEGLLGKAAARGMLTIQIDDLRAYTADKHRTVDDVPYGGGAGMVMKVDVWAAAIARARAELPGARVVLLTPQGEALTDRAARRLAAEESLVFCCGRYEGVDERVADHLVDEWLSIGDFVLTGGEPAALAAVDAIARKLPGVIGRAESVKSDTFTAGLKFPQYTRPPVFQGWPVPEVLLSGNHRDIAAWREQEALRRTAARRADLTGPAAAPRVQLIAREPAAWELPLLLAARSAYGLASVTASFADRETREAHRRSAPPELKVVGPLGRYWQQRPDDLRLHLSADDAPGGLTLAQAAQRCALAAGAAVTWGEDPPRGSLSLAPVLPGAAPFLGLLAWLERFFGHP